MFRRLFGHGNTANQAITDALYGQIVAAARQKPLYSAWLVPDTPLGRFEMLALHVFLFLHRLRGEKGALFDIAQVVTDRFFAEVEDALRDLGIGDVGVPKRMKKLARMFYGRASSYGDAVDRGDARMLAAALERNVCPGVETWPQSAALAAYVLESARLLAAGDVQAIAAGHLHFPAHSPDSQPSEAFAMRETADSPVSFQAHVGRLPSKGMPVAIDADERQRQRLAEEHGLLAVERYRADLLVERWKRNGVKVTGRVEADIVQRCVVTLEPIETHISEPLSALYLPDDSKLGREGIGLGGEILLDADGPDGPELFAGDTIDVGALAEQFFALAIDPYPRKPGADLAPAPEPEDRETPFAKLAALKKS